MLSVGWVSRAAARGATAVAGGCGAAAGVGGFMTAAAAWRVGGAVEWRLSPVPTAAARGWAVGGVRLATSKAGGSTKNGRDSNPKYLGVKKFGGHWVEPGNIILRQRGQRYGIVTSTGTVAFGTDWTIFALQPGYVKFRYHKMQKKYYVEVVKNPPTERVEETYPICRVPGWSIPDLLKLPATTPITDGVRAQLVAHLAAIHPAHFRRVLPPGQAVVGGVERVFWDATGRLLHSAFHTYPTPEAASASPVAAPPSTTPASAAPPSHA